jgi:voltage-gated potassium channel
MSTHADFQEVRARLPVDPRDRRGMLAGSVFRILAASVVLLVLYAVVPVPGTSGVGALVGLIAGLVAFVAVVGWEIRAIARSDHPVMRAVEVIAVTVPMLAVVFAFTYLSLSGEDPASFSEHLTRVDAFYYTVATMSTVGFGDVSAESDAARILVTVQMLFDLALIAGLVRLVILATRTGLQRQTETAERR